MSIFSGDGVKSFPFFGKSFPSTKTRKIDGRDEKRERNVDDK